MPSTRNTPALKSSPSHQQGQHDPVVVPPAHAPIRRAAITAAAYASLGALINIILIAGFVAAGFTMHTEQQLQQRERGVLIRG
jgi:3-deoxy-D-arabino-heptulosonate 7-phosphate (DAHP) synthase